MPAPTAERVRKRRLAMRDAGLRPLQIWVPDTRQPALAQECHRQARLVADSDRSDHDLRAFIDAAWVDLDGTAK